MEIVVGALILWVVPIFVTSAQGRAKHRVGFAYGFFLGWIGVLVLAVLPALPPPTDEHGNELGGKTCPECAEQVQPAAKVCRFCGFRFDQADKHALTR